MDRVAAVAGVTKPSIYHFFGDREGLIVAAQAERFRRTIAVGLIDLDRVVECDTQQEYAALIHGAVSASSSADGAERRRLRIQVLGSASTRPELRTAIDAVHRETVASLAKALGYGQRRGWFRSDFDAASLAAWWFGVVLGRHLVDEFGDATEVAEWPSITWSAVAHLMGVPSDAPHSD